MASRDDYIIQQLKKLDTLEALNTKIDGIATDLRSLSATVAVLQTTVSNNSTSIATNTSDIAELREEMTKYKAEVKALKTTHNMREQRLHATTIRLFNFPTMDGESVDNYRPLALRIYDRFIRPALVAAKAAGDIGVVSQQQNCIEACFRVFSPREPSPGAPPPPVIIRLSTNSIKFAVMKHRKHVLAPNDTERLGGAKRFIIVEDLTPEAHSLLKALQSDSRTEKVWTLNGVIHYSRPGILGFSKVKNVFDTVDEILGGSK